MSMVINKIEKAILSLERAKTEYNSGEKRSAVCSLDYAKDYIRAGFWLLHAEIEEEQQKKDKRKEQVKEAFDECVKKNGKALKKLSDN